MASTSIESGLPSAEEILEPTYSSLNVEPMNSAIPMMNWIQKTQETTKYTKYVTSNHSSEALEHHQ